MPRFVPVDHDTPELAATIGVSRTTITHIESEKARPTLWVLLKMAGGLGLALDESWRSPSNDASTSLVRLPLEALFMDYAIVAHLFLPSMPWAAAAAPPADNL